MFSYENILKEAKTLSLLAFPLVLNLLSYMAMQLVDTIMLGQLGPHALAAAALGSVTFIAFLVFCIGTLTSVSTLCARALGENDKKEVTKTTQQGIWIAIFLGIIGTVYLFYADNFLLFIGQPKEVVVSTRQFLNGLMWGFLPTLGFVTLREFVTALSKPNIVMIISTCAIPLNALLNYLLMYGKLGLPALAIMGVGIATAIVDWLMLIALIFYVAMRPQFRTYKIFSFAWPHPARIKRMLLLGFPVGITFAVEEFLFVITAILIGYFGVVPLAAHQIAMQCMTTAAMASIGISQAVAVRVSHGLGVHPKAAILSAYSGLALGLIFSVVAAFCFWLFGRPMASIFINIHDVNNIAVVKLAVSLLLIAAVFHIIDVVQMITNGILRGFQDTFFPMVLGVFSFWVIGIGSGYYFGFHLGYQAKGLWWGLALGLTVSAILLQSRFRWQVKRLKKSKSVT